MSMSPFGTHRSPFAAHLLVLLIISHKREDDQVHEIEKEAEEKHSTCEPLPLLIQQSAQRLRLEHLVAILRGNRRTDVWGQDGDQTCSGWVRNDGTHRYVTAVDQYLHDWLVLVGVHRGQVVQETLDWPISPFSEFTGQMFDVRLVELPFQDMWENLQAVKGRFSHDIRSSTSRLAMKAGIFL